ncbi:MAG: hypothetical protein J6E49_02650 [Acidaminococcaceae bacterium]|nr:hypothetical protein [Acidaminococcaceae bacterium]MBO5605079.1 hypothetical protein [Acidaminococcaceae bacterium]MBO5636056.1 hypothetical protein [Acidaminococcaceae bacterium]MBP3811990.1 hypothetical protein [Acidaminococcaceae bacterium]MBR1494195.1 hypothetical protein [Acidaminococcaceae bacterium]
MSETKQYNENELFEMYDYLLQKEKELEAAILKSSPEGLNTSHEKEQLTLLKSFVRQEIKALIQREALAGNELSSKIKNFQE